MFKELGIILISVGILLILIGGILYVFTGFFGKFPFDIVIKGKDFVFYFPLGTSILISIILSLLLALAFRYK